MSYYPNQPPPPGYAGAQRVPYAHFPFAQHPDASQYAAQHQQALAPSPYGAPPYYAYPPTVVPQYVYQPVPTYAAAPLQPAPPPYVQHGVHPQQGYVPQAQQMPGYVTPQYTHAMVPGVQVDQYGLPLVPGDAVLQYAQTFRVEEKVLSATHDSFVVRDQTGALRYKVDGSFTIHERKSIKDIHGQTLLKLKEARLTLRDRLTIFSPNDVPVMVLQKTSAVQIGTKRVHGYLGSLPKAVPDLVITGNHNNTFFRIINSQNMEIGVIRRKKYSLKNMLTDQDTYEVTVQAGSPALVCFIAVVLDEIYED